MNRKDRIMKYLLEKGSVTTKELSQAMNVSLDSIRRDFTDLEAEGKLKKVYGGAVLPNSFHAALNYGSREVTNVDLKQEAAKKAVAIVEAGDLIALNSGTTNVLVAQELCYLDFSITIVTNNIAATEVLYTREDFNIHLLGGKIQHREKSTYGNETFQSLSHFHPDKAFLNFNAVSLSHEFSDFRDFENIVIRTMIQNSQKSYAVMDSSKLGNHSFMTIADFNEIDGLYMDSNVSEETIEEYQQAGLAIY